MKADVGKMRIKGQGHLYGSLDQADGVCARVGCGWHAELGDDGYCLTEECRAERVSQALKQGKGMAYTDPQGNRYVVYKNF